MQFLINNPQFWRSNGLNEEVPENMELKLKDGKLELPAEIKEKLGLNSETEFKIKFNQNGIYIERADPQLTKVYIEPTSDCNLDCKTCVRHSWEEEMGFMQLEDYKKLVGDLKKFKGLEKISFWGIGEPLYHPELAEMIELASELEVKTQIITNGLLLDQK